MFGMCNILLDIRFYGLSGIKFFGYLRVQEAYFRSKEAVPMLDKASLFAVECRKNAGPSGYLNAVPGLLFPVDSDLVRG